MMPRLALQTCATVLTYLETQTATPGSFLYQKVDVNRLATAGHSLGGSTALATAARERA